MAKHSPPLTVSGEELQSLEAFSQNNPDARLRQRAAMVLAVAKGKPAVHVAEDFQVKIDTVLKWKERYAKEGLAGLRNLPRGKSRSAGRTDFRGRLMAAVKSPPPEGHNAWTVALLAEHLNASETSVRNCLKKEDIVLSAKQAAPKAKPASVPAPVSASASASAPAPASGEEPASISCIVKMQFTPEYEIREIITAFKPDEEEKEASAFMSMEFRMQAVEVKTGKVVVERSVVVPEAVADMDHFDISTLNGFRRDLSRMEASSKSGILEVMRQFREACEELVIKKIEREEAAKRAQEENHSDGD